MSKNKKKKLKRKAKRQQRLLDERLLDLQRMEELDSGPAPWRLGEDAKEDEENTQSKQNCVMFLYLFYNDEKMASHRLMRNTLSIPFGVKCSCILQK